MTALFAHHCNHSKQNSADGCVFEQTGFATEASSQNKWGSKRQGYKALNPPPFFPEHFKLSVYLQIPFSDLHLHWLHFDYVIIEILLLSLFAIASAQPLQSYAQGLCKSLHYKGNKLTYASAKAAQSTEVRELLACSLLLLHMDVHDYTDQEKIKTML